MIKQYLFMFALSFFVSLLMLAGYVNQIKISQDYYLAYLAGYVAGSALILMICSLLIAAIPKLFYWLINKKKVPDLLTLTWSTWVVITVLLMCTLIITKFDKSIGPHNPTQVTVQTTNMTAQDVYKKVVNSIFTIYSKDKNNNTVGSGGGVSISSDYIATNCHVVTHDDHFTIATGDKEYDGILYSVHGDICLVTISKPNFTPVNMRHSKDVNIGEVVYAVGNPDVTEKSISNGIISNKYDSHGVTILLTNAAISPGSSGGGLFDQNGNLIGITTAINVHKDVQNINYALPTELIEAALLEPKVDLPMTQDTVNQPKSTPTIDPPSDDPNDIKILGEYGEDKILLFYTKHTCMIAIPGRYKPQMVTSVAIFLPDKPNGLFIFSRVHTLTNVMKFFDWISSTDKVRSDKARSSLLVNNKLKSLTLMNINGVNQPVYIYNSPTPITEDLVTLDNITAQFYNFSQDGYMSSVVFGLAGFTEALASYNEHCNGNKQ